MNYSDLITYSNKGNLVYKYDPKMKSKEKHYYLLKGHTDMVFITIVQREACTSLYGHKSICLLFHLAHVLHDCCFRSRSM